MKSNFLQKVRLLGIAAAFLGGTGMVQAQNYKWTEYLAQGLDLQTCSDVATDGKGNVYSVGWYEKEAYFDNTFSLPYDQTNDDAGGTYEDGYLVKFNRSGAMPTSNADYWSIKISHGSNTYNYNERAYAVATYPNGSGGFDIYIVGTYNNTLKFTRYNYNSTTTTYTTSLTAPNGQGGYIAKFTDAGALTWCYKLDGTGTDIMYDVCVNSDGSSGLTTYVCGYFQGSSGNTFTANGTSSSTVSLSPLVTGGTEAFLVRYSDAGSSATPQWGKSMGNTGNDSYYSVAAGTNGDVVVAGQTRGTNGGGKIDNTSTSLTISGDNDAVMARYNVSGTRTYYGAFGGSTSTNTSNDAGLAVAMDVNGDSYVAGYYTGTGAYSTITGCSSINNPNGGSGWDTFIGKINSSGTCQWTKFCGTTNDGDAIQSIVVDNTGKRVYGVGNFKGDFKYDGTTTIFSSYSSTNIDGFLVGVEASSGAYISGSGTYFGGSSHDDNGRTIAINSVEDIFVGGATSSQYWKIGSSGNLMTNNDGTGGTYEAYLFRWDHSNWPAYVTSSGTTTNVGVGEWVSSGAYTISSAGSVNGSSVSFPNSVGTISSTANIIGNYSDDVYMANYNTFGDYTSVYHLMNGNCYETASDACVDASGNVYYTGYGTTGAAGPTMTFVGTGIGTYTGSGRVASFIGKSNSSGSNQWGVFLQPASTGDVYSYGICTDNSGNVYVTGGFSVSFTVSSTTVTATSAEDIFVIKLNSSGAVQWAVNFASTSSGSERGYAISVDNAATSSYYVTGIYNTTGTLTFGSNALGATTLSDIFVMKGSCSTGAASKGYAIGGSGQDYGYGICTPNSTETYIACGRNSGSYAYVASVDLTSTPALNWSLSSTTGGGYSNAIATQIAMANGYLYVSGETGSGTLQFGSLSKSPTAHAYVLSVASWNGAATNLEIFSISGSVPTPQAIAMESGELADDHGDNAIVAGYYGTAKAFVHKFSAEGCIASERRPGPVVPEYNEAGNIAAASNSIVYPNPMNHSATLEIRGEFDFENSPATIEIIDMTGRVVSTVSNMNSTRAEISTSDLSEGIYLYRVVQAGNVISSGRIAVQH